VHGMQQGIDDLHKGVVFWATDGVVLFLVPAGSSNTLMMLVAKSGEPLPARPDRMKGHL